MNDSEKIKIVVINEHTLAIIRPEYSDYAEILHTSILRGSYYNNLSGAIYIVNETVRLANRQDFKDYRMVITGFDNPDVYLWNMS